MNYKSICASALLMTGFLLATTEATAAGPAGNAVADMGGRRDVLSGNTDDAQQQPASGDIAELQQMIRDGKVRELRTTYNGSYGASLLYYPDEMLYYVAMFQQKKFWRVIKTQNDARAESVYADFAKSTIQLSDTELRRVKLEAEKSYADRLIATQQNRASRLQADLDVARAQQSQVADRQQQQQEAIRELRNEQAAAQAQLRALQARVQDLQKQQEGDLPTPAK
ncbi:DUF2968 domain-containing protein [Caballeronia telluris]|uniref:Signal peptide protein n=1 Tax=Caballeronia telluris TaxID=326475 RepID=A0A158JC04_9BURK|nr:DUF2968 domain-containing protein [Caballeronia telluris]SAL66346.1 signal peptide protein [Caballeronia telluris]